MSDPIIWSLSASVVRLPNNEVHLWKANLDLNADSLSACSNLLNEQERSRAYRFVFEKDKNRFTAARGILRQLLGGYLKCSPECIEFAAGAWGKPALHDHSALRFNQSDSGGLALYAFSLGREVGVDVENTRRNVLSAAELVQQFFSEKEQAEFSALNPKLQEQAFYLGWTRKEAYVKARGKGLHADLKIFDVSLTPERPFVLTSTDAERWGLYSFCPEAGFTAALVVEGKDFSVRHWEWHSDAPSTA